MVPLPGSKGDSRQGMRLLIAPHPCQYCVALDSLVASTGSGALSAIYFCDGFTLVSPIIAKAEHLVIYVLPFPHFVC